MSNPISNPILSPAQSRAGRALVGATADQLAEAAGLSERSVIGFEGGGRSVNRETLIRLTDGLRRLGVGLVNANGLNGAGVFALEPLGDADLIDRRVLSRTAEIGFVAVRAGQRTTGRVVLDALGNPPAEDALDAFDAAWPRIRIAFAVKLATSAVDGRGMVVISATDLAQVEEAHA